jgi:beta-galactosidase
VFRRVFAPGTSSVVRIEADSAASGFAPENAVDGDPDTIWHTPFSDETVPYPHELRIQYAREMKLAGLKVLPRQDVANAYIGRYEVYTAPDGRHWKGPVAEGEFPAGKAPQTVQFAEPAKTSWIKFVALTSAASDNFAAVAELEPVPAK